MTNGMLGLGITTVFVTATSSFAGGASLSLLDAGFATDVTIDSVGATRVLTSGLNVVSGQITIYDSYKGSSFLGTIVGEGLGQSISLDATAIAAKAVVDGQYQAARWTQSGGWEALGNLGATGGASCNESNAYGVSADGSTIAGLAYENVCSGVAFVWDEGAGMRGLDVAGTYANRASVISADGSTAAGFGQSASRSPAVWNADDGSVIYFDATTDGEFLGLTPDGSTAVGRSDGPAVYWNACEGLVPIGMLPGNTGAEAYDVSADGTRIVGASGTVFEGYRAFIWMPGTGMQSLEQVLIDLGVSIPEGVILEFANAISADGTVVVGRAWDPSIGGVFPYRSFVATLPTPVPDPCPADINDSGQVGFSDLTQLLNGWGPCACPNDCPEDLDGDGQVGFSDLTGLLNMWGPCA